MQERGSLRFSRVAGDDDAVLAGEHHGMQSSGRSTGHLPAESGAALSRRCARDLRSRGRLPLANMYGMAEGTDEPNSGGSAAVGSRASMPVPARCRGDGRVYRIASDTSGASSSGTATVLCSA
jgi:hypothetical protein